MYSMSLVTLIHTCKCTPCLTWHWYTRANVLHVSSDIDIHVQMYSMSLVTLIHTCKCTPCLTWHWYTRANVLHVSSDIDIHVQMYSMSLVTLIHTCKCTPCLTWHWYTKHFIFYFNRGALYKAKSAVRYERTKRCFILAYSVHCTPFCWFY